MLTRTVIILVATSVCAAHPSFNHQANVGEHRLPPQVDQGWTKPTIQQTDPHNVETQDLKTDASTWWRSWNNWGRSWNYNYPSVSYSSSYPTVSYGSSYSYPSVSHGNSYSYPSVSQGNSYSYPSVSHGNSYSYPSVSYASSYPTYYTEKTHYVYTPKTYTYYEPTTYSTHYSVPTRSHQQWAEPQVSYQSYGHGHESW